MTFALRDASPADLHRLRDIFRRASLSNAGDRANLLAHPEVLRLDATAVSAVTEGCSRVVTADGRVVGFATTTMTGDALEVDDLFVDPDWMGRGAGRELVLDIVATARQRGVRRVDVTANNHALAFYEKVGFVVDGDVETLFGSAPRMHLDVSTMDAPEGRAATPNVSP